MDIHKEISLKKMTNLHPKLEGVTIPKSTENELIIPCRVSYYGYILLNEKKDYVSDLKTERINQTIYQINKKIDEVLIEKKLEESKDYQQDKILMLRGLFIAGVVIAFVMYMLVLYEVNEFKEKYIFIPLAVLIAIVVLSLIIMVKGLMTERMRVNVDKLVPAIIDKILKAENELYYQSHGYLFEKNSEGLWLSLKKVF